MALTTRCPQCGTSFKVVPDQLRVRNGLVRCGACATVFDGRACLLPEAGAPPVAPPPAAPSVPPAHANAAPVLTPPAAPVAAPAEIPPWEDEPHIPAVAPEPPPAPAPSPAVLRGRDDIRRRAEPMIGPYADPDGRSRHVDVRDEARDDEYEDEDEYAQDQREDYDDPREPVLGDTRTRYSSATDVGRAPPEFLDQDREDRRSLIGKLWGAACLAGLIALAFQLLYVYRSDIANAVPALRPVLESVCRPPQCTVGYARRIERIAISSSSLQPPAGAAAIDDGRTRLVLRLVLRNRYDKPQHWPALVLDLTDLSDTVVVRRVLMPENYLTPEQLRGPFAPAGEMKVSVPIEVTGVQVNGYQIDKFFP